MIKRWSLENGMMLSDDCGQFVDIEDYERLEAERDRLSKALITVQDERAASFAMLQKTVGEPYGLTPYQPEVDLEISSNIQRLRARHAALVEAVKNYSEMATPDTWNKVKAALAEVK